MLAAVGVAVVQLRGGIGSERKGDSCFIRSIVSGRGVVVRAVVVIVGAVAGRAVPIIIGAVAGFGRRAFILGCAVGGGLIDRLIRRAVASALIIWEESVASPYTKGQSCDCPKKIESGDDLLSRAVASQVPSAC